MGKKDKNERPKLKVLFEDSRDVTKAGGFYIVLRKMSSEYGIDYIFESYVYHSNNGMIFQRQSDDVTEQKLLIDAHNDIDAITKGIALHKVAKTLADDIMKSPLPTPLPQPSTPSSPFYQAVKTAKEILGEVSP